MTIETKLGIVAALEREVSDLIAGWPHREIVHSGHTWELWESKDAVLICVGTGFERAYLGTKVLIETARPEVVTSIGFAGAATPDIAVGEVFLPAEVLRLSNGARYPCECGKGLLATLEDVAGPEQKRDLAERFGVVAVDMESAGVAKAAHEAGRRFLAVKTISDTLDDDVEFVSRFVRPEGFQTERFVAHIAVRPRLWGAVGRLARNSGVASKALTPVLASLTQDVETFVARHTSTLRDRGGDS